MRLKRRPNRAPSSTPPRVPWYLRHGYLVVVITAILLGLALMRLSASIPGFLFFEDPILRRIIIVAAALGLLLYAGHAYRTTFVRALEPLPIAHFVPSWLWLWSWMLFRGSAGILHKTFFVRNGRVIGDRTRVARENQRPNLGLVIVDGVSAAVFRDQRNGGLVVRGPGVSILSAVHELVATLSLRPVVVAYGGNRWADKPPEGAADTTVELSGARVSARLVGVFALLSPEDYPQPYWYAWLKERAQALNEPEPVLNDADARAYRQAFEAETFRTIFHGHGWSARAFAEEMLTEVLERVAHHPDPAVRDQVPELLSGSIPMLQALLKDAWIDEVTHSVGEATKLFEPMHPLTELRWIDEVQRAFRERFTQPEYIPAGGDPQKRRRSREYWRLRAMGLKATTAVVAQVYFPPQVEERLIMAAYEPLWAFLEQLRGQARRYRRVTDTRAARYQTIMTYAIYMRHRTDALLPKSLADVLQEGDAAGLARLLLGLTEGSLDWLREDVQLGVHDPRMEHLRRLRQWLRMWLREVGGPQ